MIRRLLPAIALSVAGCAASRHSLDEQDFAGGFDASDRNVALVGPLDGDRGAYDRIKELEEAETLGTLEGEQQARIALRPASQTMLAATAPVLFRAGVYYGSPQLIGFACESARRVTHAGLRRTNALAQFEQACEGLAGHDQAGAAPACQDSISKLVRAVHELEQGSDATARRSAAEGLRLHARCPSSKAFARTPVRPESRGFIIVVALQALGAAPATYLGNESAPRASAALNAAFAQNTRLIKSGSN